MLIMYLRKMILFPKRENTIFFSIGIKKPNQINVSC